MIELSVADMEARPYESNGEHKAELKIGRATVSRMAWVAGDGGGQMVTEEIGTGETSLNETEEQGLTF